MEDSPNSRLSNRPSFSFGTIDDSKDEISNDFDEYECFSSDLNKYDVDRISKNNNGPCGLLILEMVEATGIPPMDYHSGTCDPYVKMSFGTKKYRTPVIKRTLHPKWKHQFRILLYKEQLNYDVVLELHDWNKVKRNNLFATIPIPLSELLQNESDKFQIIEQPYEVNIGKRKKLLGKITGNKVPKILRMKVKYLPKPLIEKLFWDGIVSYFDIDGDGCISLEELTPLVETLNPNNNISITEELFKDIDENGDGVLQSNELCEFMKKQNAGITATIFPITDELLWKVFLSKDEETDIGEIVAAHWQLNSVKSFETEGKNVKKLKRQIVVQDRESGKITIELIPNYIRVSMKLMYSSRIGRHTVSGKRVNKILKQMTERQGKVYTSPNSIKQIKPFIKFHKLNVDEIREDIDSFSNFNEFFYRKLKEVARPIAFPNNHSIAVSPADCRLSVYNSVSDATEFWIKGKTFTISSLLQNEVYSNVFNGGSVVIARLAPQDYHRFHSAVTGTVQEYSYIDGGYYTVNPIAINKPFDVYCNNKRLVTTIETQDFGQVCFVAIGATMVGSINMTVDPYDHVNKGDELGYFAFGGSTCILIFRKGSITFDQDLIANSLKPIETLIKVGDRIGIANHH